MKNNAQQLADMIRDHLVAYPAMNPDTAGRLAMDVAEEMTALLSSCPQCGAELGPFHKPVVNGTIVDFGGAQRYVVERRLAQILEILTRRFGALVTYEAISTTINAEESGAVAPMSDATMKVHVMRLRDILADTPFEILTHHAQGYSLHSRDYAEGLHDLRCNTHGVLKEKSRFALLKRDERRKPRRKAT